MREMRRRFFVEASLTAFHTDPILGEGRHYHTWRVRLWFPAQPRRDGRAMEEALKALLGAWQGTDLPAELWASEDLAAAILRIHGAGDPEGVEVWRDDGPGADAWWC